MENRVLIKGKADHRDCDKCLWATRSGGCVRWDCLFISKQEAYEALRMLVENKQPENAEDLENAKRKVTDEDA